LHDHRCMSFHRTPLAERIIGAAIEVHRHLGPGLLESAYESCLAMEFELRGQQHERQVAVPLLYKGRPVSCQYRADFVVENSLLLELKSVEQVLPVHKAQTITYVKLLKLDQGLLINFNVVRLVDGITSVLGDGLIESWRRRSDCT